MRKLTLLFALLCASVMGFAIDWSGYEYLGDGAGGGAYTNKYKVAPAEGQNVVNIQQPGWASEPGIYTSDFGGAISSCSLGDKCAIDGGGIVLYLSAFTAKETEVTVVAALGTKTFTVYYEDGKEGGGEPDPDPEPEPEPAGINWDNYFWLGDGAGGGAYTNKYKVAPAEGQNVVNIQQPGWASEPGIYTSDFGGAISSCSLGDKCAIDGGGIVLYLSAFTAKETEVTVVAALGTKTFTVYYVDGTEGGGTPEPTEIYDVNFALQSEGGVASAKSGNDAGLANNGNTGDRWWSETADMTDEQKNDQWWQVNLGQRRIFNTIQIVWEGAWGKSFDIQISDDGSAWTTVKEIRNQNLAGETFPYLQTIELAANQTAQYVRFQGIERGTQWAYSFWEFRVLLPNASVLTSIDLTAPATIAQVGGSGMALTVTPKDQNGQTMEAAISYEITPAAAGHMSGNTFIPDQAGNATIRAYSGEVYSPAVSIIGVASANLALSTNISTDNKIVAQSAVDPNGSQYDAFFAVDGNIGSVWQGRPDGISGGDDQARTFDAWFVVDLGAFYNIDLVALHFEGACSELYHIDFSANNTDWHLGYNLVGAGGINARNDYWTELDNNTKVRYVRFWSTKAATEWGMKLFEFEVYGTEWTSGDEEKPVMVSASLESSTINSAVIAVSATDNDEVARFHVVDATNGIDANFTPSDGKITINGLTHATNYNFTITAKDASNNESENSIVVPVSTPFDGTIDLALNKTAEAGCSLDEANDASKANDGLNTLWQTGDNADYANQWWYVDLGNTYNIDRITIRFENARSNHFLLQGRTSAPNADQKADDEAWNTLYEVTSEPQGDYALNEYNLAGKVARYVRFKSLSNTYNNQWGCKIREFCVYGSGIAEVDTEKPVMSSASLVSAADNHAIIAVAATDNVGIAKYHVVDAGNSFDANFVAEGGNITVSGLTGSTTYTFTITAVDFFGNESANSKSVGVTTIAHLIAPAAACPAPTWPAAQVKALYSPTYEADYNHQDWGSGTVATVDEFGRNYVTNGNGYFGADGFALNCIEMEKLHYDIWIADDATIRIVPIWGGAEQGITVSLTGQQWNSIDIDLTDYNQVANWGNIYQMKIDYAVNLTFWVANAYFYRTTPIVDSEAPTNVSASTVAERFHSVKISARATDDHGAVNFKVMNGASQVATGAAASGEAVTISVNDLALGTNYNFSVVAFDEAGNEAAPVAVAASTKALPASAPVDLEGKEIVPLFTDATTCDVTGIQSGGWGESTIAQWIDIAQDDKVFYGQNFNYAGWHSWGSDLDVTGKKFLHVDIYSTGMTQVSATPISHDPTSEGNYAIALTPDAWTSVDIPLSAYDANNIEWNKIFQFKFMGAVGGDELLIDNVYFWNWPAISLNDQEDNSAVIEANNNKHADVTVSRTFPETGEWYTLCLPFDANASQLAAALGSGYKLAELASSEDRGALIHLNFDFVNALQAGKAYMFKPGVAVTEAPLFEGVLVKDVNPATLKSECEHMTFQGTFGQITLNQENQLFVGPENYLYSPADGGTQMDAFRCFFTIANGGSLAPGKRAKVVFGPQVVTDITNVTEQSVPTKFMHNGVLYIVRDGRTYTAQGLLVK